MIDCLGRTGVNVGLAASLAALVFGVGVLLVFANRRRFRRGGALSIVAILAIGLLVATALVPAPAAFAVSGDGCPTAPPATGDTSPAEPTPVPTSVPTVAPEPTPTEEPVPTPAPEPTTSPEPVPTPTEEPVPTPTEEPVPTPEP